MKRECRNSECLSLGLGPKSSRIVRKGAYFRRSDGQRIQRYLCLVCSRTFSSATLGEHYREKKRTINRSVALLLCSGVSQRRTARILGVTRKTVVRKFRMEALRARFEHAVWLRKLSQSPLMAIQFDDLETSEHTKCKPLSVALAVEPKHRKILGFQVSSMPAKGHLSQIALRKYGPRADLRDRGWDQLLKRLKPVVSQSVEISSDENPHYPKFIKRHFPSSEHRAFRGRRGCIAGQGELKKIGFDPLFSLNHTCAMLRANMNRLFRRTWCTTKTQRGLIDHLYIYARYHNQVLTPACPL